MLYPADALRLHHTTARERQQDAAHYRLIAFLLRTRRQKRWAHWSDRISQHLTARARQAQLRIA